MLKNRVLYVINGVYWINSMELNIGGILYSDFSLEIRNFKYSLKFYQHLTNVVRGFVFVLLFNLFGFFNRCKQSKARFIFEMWTWSDSGGKSEDSIDQWVKRESPGSRCTAADVSYWVWKEIDDWDSAEQQRSSCNCTVGAVQSRGEKRTYLVLQLNLIVLDL